jgi:hypothetical protein
MTGVRSLAEAKDFSSSLCIQTSSESKPRPARDADNSPSSTAEIKNEYELYILSPLAPVWRNESFVLLFT